MGTKNFVFIIKNVFFFNDFFFFFFLVAVIKYYYHGVVKYDANPEPQWCPIDSTGYCSGF